MLTPGQVANSLNVSPATVRRWSARFARHLSPQTPNHKRAYTPDDLAVLARVRDLSATGTPLDQIDQALNVTALSADKSTALISLADFAQSLQFARDQVASLQARLDDQTAQLEKQTARLDALTAWIALPFYKRIGKQPPSQ